MEFIKNSFRYITIGSKVKFVHEEQVLDGVIKDVTINLEHPYNDNRKYMNVHKYFLVVDEIYQYQNIHESEIFFLGSLAERKLAGEIIPISKDALGYTTTELLHLPLGKHVVFKQGDIISQGIIGNDSYLVINDSDALDITYGIDLIHKENVCCMCSILDIIS